MRKIITSTFLLLVLVVVSAYAGEVKLTTYYPSPYGEYKRIITETLGVGDNDGSGTINSLDAPTNPGEVWIKGNIGIGTTSPQSVLDLGNGTGGRSLVWGGSGTNWYTTIGTSYSSADLNLLGGLKLNTGADQVLYSYTGTYGPSGIRLGFGSGDISFFNAATGAKTAGDIFDYVSNTKMVIKASGNVGIGTTSPGAKLDVTGGVKIANDSDAPALAKAGTMRYSGGQIEYCDGSAWKAVGESKAFGAWVTKSKNTSYMAATDGFVLATCRLTGVIPDTYCIIQGYTDGNSIPTTLRATAMIRQAPHPQPYNEMVWSKEQSFTMPVRKGDYWRASEIDEIGWHNQGTYVITVYWLPLE